MATDYGGHLAQPPPSTLAAQLIVNISASTRSVRSDDNAELRKLSATIQAVENEPELLKTPDDQLRHNHLLTYVFFRAVLGNVRLEDFDVDKKQLREQFNKAISFLRLIVKETPAVLGYVAKSNDFELRGGEPLWVWLFPNVLRFLGHGHCLDLSADIEGFFLEVFAALIPRSSLWELLASVTIYLRETVEVLSLRLKDLPPPTTERDPRTNLTLPSSDTLELLLGQNATHSIKQGTYTISHASQCLRQVSSLLNVLSHPLLSQNDALLSNTLYQAHKPWLLDSLLSLGTTTDKWRFVADVGRIEALRNTLCLLIVPRGDRRQLNSVAHRKASTLLALQCVDVAQNPRELLEGEESRTQPARQVYCESLLRLAHAALQDQNIARLVSSQMIHALEAVVTMTPALGPSTDFGRCVQVLKHACLSPSPAIPGDSSRATNLENSHLRLLARLLGFGGQAVAETEPVSKRRKLSSGPNQVPLLIEKIHQLLRSDPESNNLPFEGNFMLAYPNVSEEDQCAAIDSLSRICCIEDGAAFSEEVFDRQSVPQCQACANVNAPITRPKRLDSQAKRDAQATFAKLIAYEGFSSSRRPRVVAMISLKRLIVHTDDPEMFDLETSLLGQWCLKSLQSSMRELRIAAGRALAVFLESPSSNAIDLSVADRNRKNTLTLLKNVSEKNSLGFRESTIMAWGQLGRITFGDELNLVLHKLLEYLGGSNSLVASCAFNEILNIAAVRRVSCRKLFEPFWGNLAFFAVKDMISRPQISRAIAELLQISVNQLLLLIQSYALPYLVLMRKKDVVQKFVEARREKDAQSALLDTANNGPILALLMVQDVPDIESFTMSRLREFVPLENCTLTELMASEVVAIVLELLKTAGDCDEERKPQAIRALTWMCSKLVAGNTELKSRSRKQTGNVVGRFLEMYVLGLMARLADVINDRQYLLPPVEEQKRCLRAMEEMIKLCKAYVRIARPQISACLLTALARDALRHTAFSCWVALLTKLEDEDVEVLIEPTFFIINHYWVAFHPETRKMAKDLVLSIFEQFEPVLRETIDKLPKLDHIVEFADVEKKLSTLRQPLNSRATFAVFAERLSHQNSGVVQQALTELTSYLQENQSYLQASAISEQPDVVITTLLRSLLDCAAKYSASQLDIASLCARCIGLVGCLDSNQIETPRNQKSMVILTNFETSDETTDFVLFILEEILVKAFLSTTDTKFQGYLSFAMQEIMDRVEIKASLAMERMNIQDGNRIYRKWLGLPEGVREVLGPFLSSRYILAPAKLPPVEYPIFRPGRMYGNWMRAFVLDLLQKGQNVHSQLIFEPLTRVIRVKEVSVAEFLLPYLVLHVIVGNSSTEEERDCVIGELVSILQHQPAEDATYMEKEDTKLLCEAVFGVLDYAMRWNQEKSRIATKADETALKRVKAVIDVIPPVLRAQRAMDCGQYSRALFYLEHHAQELELENGDPRERTRLLEQLQDIYTQIDEPDGLEGISARLHVLDVNQQILSHKKAGRWAAAQTWYEIKLAEEPGNVDIQADLLTCLKQSGQHDVLLNYVEGLHVDATSENRIVPFAVEAAWATSRWDTLSKWASRFHGDPLEDFNVSIAQLFEHLRRDQSPGDAFAQTMQSMREKIAAAMTYSATSSLQACHDLMLRCHVLTDLEIIAGTKQREGLAPHQDVLAKLNRRLEVLGAYVNDKQYLLGIRRAAMELSRPVFADLDISSLWLSSARLARKANSMHQALNAVLHASQLGDDSAVIENARLLWKDNHSRKAIQVLQGAIDANKFATQVNATESARGLDGQQRLLTARAQLTLAKWLDAAGQTHILALRDKYQQPPKTLGAWEKGHFFLGRHYKKLMESQQALPLDNQSDAHVQGELARLVIENYLRSLSYGTKYLYQTLPRIMTLWLDLGAQVDKPPDGKVSLSRELHRRRIEQLNILHKFLDKYIQKLPAYIYYTALPQIVARIAHPNQQVFDRLTRIVVKVVEAHPRQALWGLFGIMTTRQASARRERGQRIMQSLKGITAKVEGGSYDLKGLLRAGEKLAEQLLLACNNGTFNTNRTVTASITRDLNFNHKCTPCPLVVPIETCLSGTLPTLTDNIKKHKAFSRDVITIDSFLDEVLVLGSLAKPRRLTARGSDGNNYMLLIKPKDDLRTDQRLMEFNGMINRSLKRDAESSRRQLYIRTYAVTPLNEECGIIEWVDGLKTLRDILLDQYRMMGKSPDYMRIKQMMKEAQVGADNISVFTEGVLGTFPPRLHHWFIQQFPHPAGWFSARLKYTRSAAVMSMVGTILGLGDRHAENILLEKDTGGVFHVDFNCLFDKGRTFAEPERVPFRLTHNMVTAMGMHGYEGPFRTCSELTLGILRQQEETLMTILEAFIYDPTLDLQKVKKTSRTVAAPGEVRMEPPYVVESIKRKVRGLLPNESIPLSVEGHVEELIKQAVDPRNLTAMYIGWCPFF